MTRAELEQEGWVAGIEAARTFDPAKGDNFGYHIWFRVDIAVKRFLKSAGVPVSGAGKGHENECYAGLHHVALDKLKYLSIAGMEKRAWWAYMSQEVSAAITRTCEPDLAPIMEEVLLDGVPLAQATTPHNIPLPKAMGLLRRTRYALRDDKRLREVAQELGIGV
jgi:hypothetical protein